MHVEFGLEGGNGKVLTKHHRSSLVMPSKPAEDGPIGYLVFEILVHERKIESFFNPFHNIVALAALNNTTSER